MGGIEKFKRFRKAILVILSIIQIDSVLSLSAVDVRSLEFEILKPDFFKATDNAHAPLLINSA